MSNLAQQFARECGYTGDIPAMLRAFEAIRRSGIEEARKAHFERVKLLNEYKQHSAMFFAAIRPSLSTDEAIADARAYLVRYRNMSTWMKQTRGGEVRRVKQMLVFARYFRRFGQRVWLKEAA